MQQEVREPVVVVVVVEVLVVVVEIVEIVLVVEVGVGKRARSFVQHPVCLSTSEPTHAA